MKRHIFFKKNAGVGFDDALTAARRLKSSVSNNLLDANAPLKALPTPLYA
jgi:hypothetical protein